MCQQCNNRAARKNEPTARIEKKPVKKEGASKDKNKKKKKMTLNS